MAVGWGVSARSRLRLALGRRPSPGVRWGAGPWTGFTGLLALALLALLCLSGAVMALYYSPAPGVAYDSVDHAQFNLPFGEVVRGVHAYAWNLLLIVLVLHLGRAFVVAAHKAPWQGAWISAVLVMLLVPAFIVTGDLLPWNQSGFWSTRVRLGIMSSVPLVGEFLVGLLGGGSHIGIVTLTRFYVLHILFLPCLLIGMLALHLRFIGRGLRASPPAGSDGAMDIRRLVLDLSTRWLVLFLVVVILLGLISWQRPVPLGDPADPTDTSYIPRPEWWVLPLNQLVTIFTGPLTVFATVIIPGGLVGLLLALPFIAGPPASHPGRRKAALLASAGIAAGLLLLAVMGYIEHYLPTGDRGGSAAQAVTTGQPAKK